MTIETLRRLTRPSTAVISQSHSSCDEVSPKRSVTGR